MSGPHLLKALNSFSKSNSLARKKLEGQIYLNLFLKISNRGEHSRERVKWNHLELEKTDPYSLGLKLYDVYI